MILFFFCPKVPYYVNILHDTVLVKLSYLLSLCNFPLCGCTYADFICSSVSPQPGSPTYFLTAKAVLSDLCSRSLSRSLSHSSRSLTYVGIPWRAQKDSEQEWTSVVFVFPVLGTSFLSLFWVSWAGSACLFPAEITSLGDAEVAFLTIKGMTTGDWYCFS